MKKSLVRILSFLLCFCMAFGSMLSLVPDVKAVSENEATVANFLQKQMGLNVAAVCGVLANVEWESGFDPNCVGDMGTSYGICQWHASRWDDMKTYCNNKGYDWKTIGGQLRFLKYELETKYPSILSYIKGVSNTAAGAYDAAYYWCKYFERPADTENMSVKRGNLAKTRYWVIFNNNYSLIGDGAYRFQNMATKKYLSVKDAGDANGQNIEISASTGKETVFDISVVFNTVYGIKADCSKAGRMVNIYASYVESGKNVTLYDKTNDNSQQWYFQKTGEAYVIRSVAEPSCVLTVSGTNVIVSAYTGADEQKWTLTNLSTYTVKYNANGGTGAPASQSKRHGTAIVIPDTVPVRDGYIFKGWATSASATQAKYIPGAIFDENGDITLYAVWQIAPCEGYGGTGHNWSFVKITKAPDCTNNGKGNYYCSKCKETRELPLDEKDIYTAWTATKPTGYPEDALRTKTQYRALTSENGENLQQGTGTTLKAVFPSGFDKTNSLYKTYNNSVASTATRKYSSDKTLVGYIYWHWCCSSYTNTTPGNYYINEVKTDGSNGERAYNVFHAFYSKEYHAYDTSKLASKFENASACKSVYWWNEPIPVYEYKYTEYSAPVTQTSSWQDTPITKAENVIVETRTLYRYDLHALGHSYKAQVNKATCTTDGYTMNKCVRCDEYYIDKIVSATENAGHSYTKKVVAATCAEDGYTRYQCTTCGNVYMDSIVSATGHVYKNGACTKCGAKK